MFTILALLCIILGFLGAILDVRILFDALTWFVAAIAFNTLGGIELPFAVGRRT